MPDWQAWSCRFLGVEYTALRHRVLAGGADEEVLAWCYAPGKRLSEAQVLIWDGSTRQRGWRDEEDSSTRELERHKASSGLAHRSDIVTFFDYFEVDEGRLP